MFLDETGIGGPLYDRLRQLGHKNVSRHSVRERFAEHQLRQHAGVYVGADERLAGRGSIPKNTQLEQDLAGPGYKHDKQDRLVLESKEDMKKRGLGEYRRWDALALTFAQTVAPELAAKPINRPDWARPSNGARRRWLTKSKTRSNGMTGPSAAISITATITKSISGFSRAISGVKRMPAKRGEGAVVVNKLDTPVTLIVNQVAQAMPGPKVSRRDAPDTEGAAEVREGILRDIEYVSRAEDCTCVSSIMPRAETSAFCA
jgi:hypothetical protein